MTRTLTKLCIFVASTGDLGEERQALARAVESLNKSGRSPESLGITLELLRWETHVPPGAGRPQEHIFKHLPSQDWDIFVGILWKRFGTETGAADPSTGEDYLSGTEEEFKEALRRCEAGGTRWPWIMFYRCIRHPASILDIDTAQLARVNEFFKECDPGGKHPVFSHHYDEPADFERMVREHLEDVVNCYADDFLGGRGGGGVTGGAGASLPAPEWPAGVTMPGSFLRYALDRFWPALHILLTRRIGRPEPPREWPVLNKYLSTFRSNIAADIKQKTYVEPHAKAPPMEEADRLEPRQDAFLLPIQQLIKEIVGVSYGGDAQSAQISAISRKSKFVDNLVKRLLTAGEPLVLLGDPGTGKSITLQQAAMVIAERESKRVFPSVCVFVRLGEFRPPGRATEESVRDYVKQAAQPEIRPYLDSLATHGRLIVFFDGMDEMSRERYDDYTNALSVFAESMKDAGTQTLFSCRITDFTPRFQHRRLVLLPFGRRQIQKYLARQLNFPITIGGRSWAGARQLAKRLAEGGLPMQADNPFVLWLLCTYMRKEQDWPESRVHLLAYYNRYNYERKAQDAALAGRPLPEMETAFLTWARVAYEITNRNRGAALPLRDAESLLAPQELPALQAAMQCGVIQKSTAPGETLIRFEHHRFQEYFTAHHLSRNPAEKAKLNWLDKLDAPRWQETLFNLVLMGGGGEALAALSEAVAREHSRLAAETEASEPERPEKTFEPRRSGRVMRRVRPDRSKREAPEPENRVAVVKDAAAETLLADRVELAARVLQQTQQLADAPPSGLPETFREAAYWLADHGNPITRVKMLLASKAVQGVDIFRVAREALASNVSWVRQQALIVTSAVRRDVGGDALQEDIAHNFASGRFLNRLPGYFRIASALRQRHVSSAVAAGLLLTCVQVLAVYGLVVGAYRAAAPAVDAATAAEIRSLKRDYTGAFIPADERGNERKFVELDRQYKETLAERGRWMEIMSGARGWLESWYFFLLVSGAFALTFLYTMRRWPGSQSLTSPVAGLALILLPYVWWALWLKHWPQLAVLIMLIGVIVPLLVLAVWALALLVHASTLVLFTTAPARHKGFAPPLRTMLEAAWENCGFRTWASWPPGLVWLWCSGYLLTLILVAFNRDWVAALIAAYGLFHRFPPALDAALSVTAAYAAFVLLPAAVVLLAVRGRPGLSRILKKFVVWSAAACAAVPGVALTVWGLTFVEWESVRRFALAAGLLPFFPPAVNVALSFILYAGVCGAALGGALRLVSGWEAFGRSLLMAVTVVCVVAVAFVMLFWGIDTVNWGTVWAFVASTFGLLGSLPPSLNAAFSLAIHAEAVGVVASVVYGMARAGWAGGLRLLWRWTLWCLGFAACCLLLWLLYLNSDYLARALAVVICIALAAIAVDSLRGVMRGLAPSIGGLRGPMKSNLYSPQAWKNKLAELDPDNQAAFLRRSTADVLGLHFGDFLALLQSVEGLIKKDPAQSAYWAKRQQIEQIIRQEKIG